MLKVFLKNVKCMSYFQLSENANKNAAEVIAANQEELSELRQKLEDVNKINAQFGTELEQT